MQNLPDLVEDRLLSTIVQAGRVFALPLEGYLVRFQFAERGRELFARLGDFTIEVIRLGAYSAGSDAKVDQAIHYHDRLEEFLHQPKSENTKIGDGFDRLSVILGTEAE